MGVVTHENPVVRQGSQKVPVLQDQDVVAIGPSLSKALHLKQRIVPLPQTRLVQTIQHLQIASQFFNEHQCSIYSIQLILSTASLKRVQIGIKSRDHKQAGHFITSTL